MEVLESKQSFEVILKKACSRGPANQTCNTGVCNTCG